MSKHYRITDAPNTSIVKLELSMAQIKLLESLVSSELNDVEHGDSLTDENALQGLCDVFWRHLHIPLTAAEQKADEKPYMDAYHASNLALHDHLARTKNGGLES